MAAQYPIGGRPPSSNIAPSFKDAVANNANTSQEAIVQRQKKLLKGPGPILDHVLPQTPRHVREKLFWEIYELRNNPDRPDDVNIHVIQRPDGEYKAIYMHKKTKIDGTPSGNTPQRGKGVKKPKKYNTLREALRANHRELLQSNTHVQDAHDDSDGEYLDAVDEIYGDAELMSNDFRHQTPSGRIKLQHGCSCPCGCSKDETPARSHRLDLTNKKPVCNTCGINQLRRKAGCWEKQNQSVKDTILNTQKDADDECEEAAIISSHFDDG